MPEQAPPVPDGARELRERGAFTTDLQHCLFTVLRLLGAGSGTHPDASTYRMPVDTDWDAVLGFYGASLSPRWRRVPAPETNLGFRLAIWRRGFPSARTFAVALLDEVAFGSEDPDSFRVLAVFEEPSPRH